MQVVFLIPYRINIGCVANILVKRLVTFNIQLNLWCIYMLLFNAATFNLHFKLNAALQNFTIEVTNQKKFHVILILILLTLDYNFSSLLQILSLVTIN